MSQPATSTVVHQNVPQPSEMTQTGFLLTQTAEEVATQQTITSEEADWLNVRTTRPADNQPPLTSSQLTQDVNNTVNPVLAISVGKRQSNSQKPSDSSPMPHATDRSVPQQSLGDYGYTFHTHPTQNLNNDTLDPRLFEETTDPATSLNHSFTPHS